MRRTKTVLFALGLLCLVSITPNIFAQVTIGSGIPANAGSLLDLKEYNPDSGNANSNKGLLLPRVSLENAKELEPIIERASPDEREKHTGLLVYHVGHAFLCKGVYGWSGDRWNRMPTQCIVKILCESAKVNGTFEVGKNLNASNTITLKIDVPPASEGGVYDIYTHTENGMKFSAKGTLVKGIMNITLAGTGAPKSGGSETKFTIYAKYTNAEAKPATCSVTISAEKIPIARAGIFGFGAASGTYGYHLESSASRRIMTSAANFGTASDSKVQSSGVTFTQPLSVDGITVANFVNSSAFRSNPDIIINGYHSHIPTSNTTAVVDALQAYLEQGGVLILLDEYNSNTTNITLQLCRRLFPAQASRINHTRLGGPGSVYTMTSTEDDEIINGPFGNVKGVKWGEDASTTNGYGGLPADSITIYSNGNFVSPTGAQNNNADYVTMFKHNRLNLFVIGDGGFNSNPNAYIGNNYGSRTICPLSIDNQGRPLDRIGWGNGGTHTVANGRIFANIMAWALRNASSNNKK